MASYVGPPYKKVIPGLHVKMDCTLGRLYSQTSFIYKYKMLCGYIKGVSGGRFVLIIYDVMCNPRLRTIQL